MVKTSESRSKSKQVKSTARSLFSGKVPFPNHMKGHITTARFAEINFFRRREQALMTGQNFSFHKLLLDKPP